MFVLSNNQSNSMQTSLQTKPQQCHEDSETLKYNNHQSLHFHSALKGRRSSRWNKKKKKTSLVLYLVRNHRNVLFIHKECQLFLTTEETKTVPDASCEPARNDCRTKTSHHTHLVMWPISLQMPSFFSPGPLLWWFPPLHFSAVLAHIQKEK